MQAIGRQPHRAPCLASEGAPLPYERHRPEQTAAQLVDHVIPQVPVWQWVLSLPIPPPLRLATQPLLVTSVLQVVHRVITGFLLDQAGLKADQADRGAVTLIQPSL